jgi:hypothetical protein
MGRQIAIGAAVAAILVAAAPARADTEPDPFEDLFGTGGINAWTPAADASLVSSDASLADSLDTNVDNFLIANAYGNGDDPVSVLVDEADPSAFTTTFDGIDNLGDPVYNLTPLNAAGDIAAGLDLTLYNLGFDYFGNPLDLPGEIFTLLFAPWLPLILAGA